MELVSAIVGPVVNLLTVHITHKLGYLTSSTEHVKRMKKRMEVLESQSADIEEHMKENNVGNRKIPARVPGWLKEVKKIKEDVDNISSNDIGCFDVKKKYRAGRNALRLIEDIESLIKESSDNIRWRDAEIPLGRVDSKRLASTSGGGTQNLFKSRDKMFNDALKLLQQDDDKNRVIALCGMGGVGKTTLMNQLKQAAHDYKMFKWILVASRDKMFNDALKLLQQDDDKNRVIALCGMGGVGKTTLMNQLKQAAHDYKMFKWILVAVIGNTPNLFAIQKAIAAHIGEPLTETDETLRATYLTKIFQGFAERKEKILVILDDVWEKIKLEDIGLASPVPDGVKLLLTSRYVNVCQQIAVDADSILKVVKVDVLEEGEARDFFSRIAGVSKEHDHDLYQIGCDIVKKCGCLPLAIKLIAATLKCQKKFVWRRTLKRLKKNDLDTNVQNIIKISYESLVHDDKVIFLLCGMFPEDCNISIEDLTRYAWGLKLLEQVSTMEDARECTQTSVSNLKNAYLLMDGDSRDTEFVKMHDLVLAFVVGTVSKGGEDGCWIIHHDDFSTLSEANNMSQSCKQISLACKGMSEFPIDFKFPNLTVLKLMQGDESLRFPQDFYVGMEKLQVIAFEKLEYPLVPTSFQCSANLRTLCLDECSLMFDLNCIGNLLNLEVLSLANSGITTIPSTFRNLKRLRLLDVTGCYNLVIDDGNLLNLEVLSLANSGITTIPSTFRNLKRLRLLDVTGCYNLVIDDGVLKSLVKLEELYMRGRALSFTDNNYRELAECSENLRALEFEFIGDNAHLKNMSYEKIQRFKLSVGCYFTEVRQMHRSQFELQSHENILKLVTNREVLLKSKMNELFKITDALYLQVNDMNTLEDVDVESPHPQHPPQNSLFYNLRLLVVSQCAELKYLFTPSVATKLSKLEYLDISRCPKMKAVIHTENDGSDIIKFSNLKYISLDELPNLLHFCNNVDVIELPRLMELQLERLPHLTNIYPSSATSYLSSDISRMQSLFNKEDVTPKLEKLFVSDMKNLKEIWPPQFSISNICQLRELTVESCGSIKVLFNMDFGEIEQLSSSLKSIKVRRCDSLVKLFSCNPFPFLNNLQELNVESCGSIQVLFNTDLGRADKTEEQVCSSSLRSIRVDRCDSLVNLLPSNPMPLFNHLEELEVTWCASIEVIFDIDMGCVGETDKASSSSLISIWLEGLGKLREVWRIKDAGNNLIHGFEAVESIIIGYCARFENLITPGTTNFDMRAIKKVEIGRCGRDRKRSYELAECSQDQAAINAMPILREDSNDEISEIAFPSNLLTTFNNLHNLYLRDYEGVEVVFEITTPSSRESPHNTQQSPILPYLEKLWLENMGRMSHVWKCDWNEFFILQKPQSQSSFHNLTTITMYKCDSIKYLFSPLMAKLLFNLKDVRILSCDGIEEIVSNRDDEDTSIYSHTSTAFFPHLDILELKFLRNFKCIGGGANGISTDIHDQLKLSQASWSWSLCQYAREISIIDCDALSSVIPWYAVGQMQKLQVLKISDCKSMTEVFETQEINKSGTNTEKSLPRLEYITMLKLPNLKILKIQGCNLLEHIFTFSTLESLTQLEELVVKDCKAMKVIVMEENGQQTTASDVVVFPRLKSIKLIKLSKFVGFFLGKNEFTWPTLKKVVIRECPQMAVFTYGRSTAPKLNFMNTSLGKHSVECGLNFHVTATSHQAQLPSYESTSSYHPTTMERLPWSYPNLIEVDDMDYKPSGGQSLFSSDKLLQLQKLETVHFGRCEDTEEIFQVFESPTVAEIPNLRQVDLEELSSLKYIWKSGRWTVVKFPSLTRLSIQYCGSLEYVFTCPMVGSLLQLQELHIHGCTRMKAIVKGEEESDAIVNAIVEFPCLKSLKLEYLWSLEGFCMEKEAFEFPSLDTLQIKACREMTVFTKGDLSAPKLYAISIWDRKYNRKYNIHNRLNSNQLNPTNLISIDLRPTTTAKAPECTPPVTDDELQKSSKVAAGDLCNAMPKFLGSMGIKVGFRQADCTFCCSNGV
ncbi:resistance protein candidate RGC20 [Artemisia annua]|uniref:Resistance protein candidate RGC20 n=1 Tax=Artemisia annua TaxID=35608 RepID=A0A2U1LRG6_ARTAN|nr:resistance protein candidate RGC20 [Artemisia annua]